jgi:hypothetical protein
MRTQAHRSNSSSLIGKCENVDILRCMCGISITRDERYPRRGRWVAQRKAPQVTEGLTALMTR